MKSLYNQLNNQLHSISDVINSSFYNTDIDAQSSGNYHYDEIGRLLEDQSNNIDSIYWTVTNKIHQIDKSNGDIIRFEYDPMGEAYCKNCDSC